MSYVMGGRVLWWVGEGCGGESCGQWGGCNSSQVGLWERSVGGPRDSRAPRSCLVPQVSLTSGHFFSGRCNVDNG